MRDRQYPRNCRNCPHKEGKRDACEHVRALIQAADNEPFTTKQIMLRERAADYCLRYAPRVSYQGA